MKGIAFNLTICADVVRLIIAAGRIKLSLCLDAPQNLSSNQVTDGHRGSEVFSKSTLTLEHVPIYGVSRRWDCSRTVLKDSHDNVFGIWTRYSWRGYVLDVSNWKASSLRVLISEMVGS